MGASSMIIIYVCIVAISSIDDQLSIIPTVSSFERKSTQHSRIFWRRRSRLLSDTLVLRGGIDEETEEEGKDSMHTSLVDTDVIANVTHPNSTLQDDLPTKAPLRSNINTETETESKQEKTAGGGGVIGSVVSWFRGPAVA